MNTSYGQRLAIRQWLARVILTFVALFGPGAVWAGPVHIVAFGDSLSAGYQLPQANAFPVRLQAALKAKGLDVEVSNAGVSGDTASDGAERVDWSVPEGTNLVILELGANDMLRGLPPEVTRAALSQILTQLQTRKIKVLLCGMKAAPNLGEEFRAAFEAIYPDLAKQFNVPLYPFFLQGMAREPALTLPDGMHPNAAGVDVIVAQILPTVEATLTLK